MAVLTGIAMKFQFMCTAKTWIFPVRPHNFCRCVGDLMFAVQKTSTTALLVLLNHAENVPDLLPVLLVCVLSLPPTSLQ